MNDLDLATARLTISQIEANVAKLTAETAKFQEETLKYRREARFYPFIAVAAFIGFTAAFAKIFTILAG